MLHDRPAVGDGDCPVRQADSAAAGHMGPALAHWGAPFGGGEHTVVEQLLIDHAALVVPHLDAIAARPVGHAFTLGDETQPYAGLHYHA